MDYDSAQPIILNYGQLVDDDDRNFLNRLRQGVPPIPGQVTEILLALKVLFEALKDVPALERDLVSALFALAYDSRQSFTAGRQRGVEWPPLLDEDLERIAIAVRSILAGTWYG